jgi:hypothetical protein
MESPQLQLLPAPGEGRRIEQIKIALLHFHRADDALHGAEAGADGEIAGALLLHADDQVLAVGHVGVLRLGVHLARSNPGPPGAILADFDADHVIDLAGINGQFAAQHAVLGFDVAFDDDFSM